MAVALAAPGAPGSSTGAGDPEQLEQPAGPDTIASASANPRSRAPGGILTRSGAGRVAIAILTGGYSSGAVTRSKSTISSFPPSSNFTLYWVLSFATAVTFPGVR